MLFAYIGPETMMPIASGVAAVVGIFLMFGRSVMLVLRKIAGKVGAIVGRKDASSRRRADLPTSLAAGAATTDKPSGGSSS